MKLPLEHPATRFAISQNNKSIVVAHEDDDQVTIWDVATGKRTLKIETPSPTVVLHRNSHILVGSHDEGTLTAFATINGNKMYAKEDLKGICYISEPHNPSWVNHGLITFTGERPGERVFRIIGLQQRRQPILLAGIPGITGHVVAMIDRSTTNMILQGHLKGLPDEKVITQINYRDLIGRQTIESQKTVEDSGNPPAFLRQVRIGRYWFGAGGRQLREGNPPVKVTAKYDGVLVPDHSQDVFYECKDGEIIARALDANQSMLGKQPLVSFANMDADYRVAATITKLKYGVPHHTVATTIDGTLLLLGVDYKTGNLYRASLPAFKIPQDVEVSLAAHAGLRKEFPTKIPTGKRLEIPIAGYERAGSYDFDFRSDRRKAGDVRITRTGVLTWNPTSENIGKHRFEIEAEIGQKKETIALEIEVLPPDRLTIDEGGTGKASTFAKLPTEWDVTSMCVSEDHKYLVAAHEGDDKLTLWDIKTNQLIKTITTASPSSMLWRGERLFVASRDKGTIGIFDPTRGRLADQIQVPGVKINQLFAAQEKYFTGKILVASDREVYWVDTKADQVQKMESVHSVRSAMVDFAGRNLILDSGTHYKLGSTRPLRLGHVSSVVRNLRQVREGTFWFSNHQIAKGTPPSDFSTRSPPRFLVPDFERDVYYEFDSDQSVTCVALDAELTPVERRLINFPDVSPLFGTGDRRYSHTHSYYAALPLHAAITLDDELTFYAFDPQAKSVFTAKVPAFDIGPAAIAKARASKKDVVFPKIAVVGEEISLQLTADEGNVRQLSGSNLKVSSSGQLTWTPTERDIGPRSFQVEVYIGDVRRSFRFRTRVVKDLPEGAEKGHAIFRDLLTIEPITGMAISEDRQHLFLAHEFENKVTVWEIKSEKIVAKIDAAQPSFVMSRGDKLYVASAEDRVISVFSREDDWKKTAELPSPAGTFYLSAPLGKYFDGKILATGGSLATGRSGLDVSLVDEKAQTIANIRRDATVATSSYDGRYFLTQRPPYLQSSSTRSEYAAFPFPSRAATSNCVSLGRQTTNEFLMPVHPGAIWFGWKGIYQGAAPQGRATVDQKLEFIIPDYDRCVAYRLAENSITCFALDDSKTIVGSRPILTPISRHPGLGPSPSRNLAAMMVPDYHRNIATTINGESHLFVFHKLGRTVSHMKIDAFELNPLVNAAAEIVCGRNEFPHALPVGKQREFALLGKPTRGTYALTDGPDNMVVSDEGVVRWTPEKEDIGHHRIKIKAELDGQSAVVKLDTRVVLPENLERALANPVAFEDAGKFRLNGPQVNLRYSVGGQSILFTDRGTIGELSANGMNSIMSAKPMAPGSTSSRMYFYGMIEKRGDHFVAMSSRSVDVLDARTLQVRKSANLFGGNPTCIALHPSKPLCYISVDVSRNNTDPLRRHPILEFNESTGETRELGRVFGRGVTTDPRGRYLYSSFDRKTASVERLGGLAKQIVHVESLLLSYSLNDGGSQIKHVSSNDSVGFGFARFVNSPDGQNLAYVCRENREGKATNDVRTFAFGARDAAKTLSLNRYPQDISFHPMLPIVVATDGTGLAFFNRSTGESLPDMLKLPEGVELHNVTRVMFTPNGARLMVVSSDNRSVWSLRSVALNLSDEQRRSIEGGFVPPPIERLQRPVDDITAVRYKPEDLQALARNQNETMTAQKIAAQFSDAIVAVQGGTVIGSGCLVGSDGYILTTTDALPPIGDPIVYYRSSDGESTVTAKARGLLVREDNAQNLALLKIESAVPLKTVQFAASSEIEIADEILVMFAPDPSPKQLSPSVRKGIIKSTSRDVEGRKFVETSMKAGSTSFGGPVLNSRGHVIGLASGAPQSDEQTLAIPIQTIIQFLGAESVASPKPATPISRTWVDATGTFKIKAELLRVEAGIVHLKKESTGTLIKVPLAKLSDDDREFLKNLDQKK